jgi:hypothetical protein
MQKMEDYSMITFPWKTGAERYASGAANGRSDVGAEAIGGRLHALVRRGFWYGHRDCLLLLAGSRQAN